MIFLLDMNAISDIVREDPRIDSRLATVAPSDRVITCTIVAGESLFGAERLPPGKRRDDLYGKIRKILAGIDCEPIDRACGDSYSQIKRACRDKGISLDENDLWIAATAVKIDATVVTRDADLHRVPGLNAEDWSR
jgi:tRNA(fMet)-specific endonuclease VapC